MARPTNDGVVMRMPEEQPKAQEDDEAQRLGREKRADEMIAVYRDALTAYERAGPFKRLRHPAETAKALTGKFALIRARVTFVDGKVTMLEVLPRPLDVRDLDVIRKGGRKTAKDLVNDPMEILGFVKAYDLLSDELLGLRLKIEDLERYAGAGIDPID